MSPESRATAAGSSAATLTAGGHEGAPALVGGVAYEHAAVVDRRGVGIEVSEPGRVELPLRVARAPSPHDCAPRLLTGCGLEGDVRPVGALRRRVYVDRRSHCGPV